MMTMRGSRCVCVSSPRCVFFLYSLRDKRFRAVMKACEEDKARKEEEEQLRRCYDFKRFRQSSTVVGSKVRGQMSLEECKS